MGRDVQQALDETAQLAQRIYPPLLEAGGLAAALRSAAASAGVPASVEVTAGASATRPRSPRTVYLCCLEALEHAARRRGRRDHGATRTRGRSSFEVVADARCGSDAELDRLRDRVEALGGRLTIGPEPGGGARVSGSLPLSR